MMIRCYLKQGYWWIHFCELKDTEKAMVPHSSTLAWKIPWMEEPWRLQSMGSLRVGHDWATSLSHAGEGNGNPLQCSCLENPRDGGAWWAAIYAVAQSWTWLKWLSSKDTLKILNSNKLTEDITIWEKQVFLKKTFYFVLGYSLLIATMPW